MGLDPLIVVALHIALQLEHVHKLQRRQGVSAAPKSAPMSKLMWIPPPRENDRPPRRTARPPPDRRSAPGPKITRPASGISCSMRWPIHSGCPGPDRPRSAGAACIRGRQAARSSLTTRMNTCFISGDRAR